MNEKCIYIVSFSIMLLIVPTPTLPDGRACRGPSSVSRESSIRARFEKEAKKEEAIARGAVVCPLINSNGQENKGVVLLHTSLFFVFSILYIPRRMSRAIGGIGDGSVSVHISFHPLLSNPASRKRRKSCEAISHAP